MIFVGYQGIGKSTLAGKNNYIDLESGNFWVTNSDGITYRPSEWIAIYVNMAQHLSNQGYHVMMSSHKALRDELNRRNIKYYTVYPSHELKDVWIAKLQERYNRTKLEKDYKALKNAEACYDENIDDLALELHHHEIVNHNYILEDELNSIISKSLS